MSKEHEKLKKNRKKAGGPLRPCDRKIHPQKKSPKNRDFTD